MYWRETGDLSVWRGIAQDAIIMNIDDLLCVGAVDHPARRPAAPRARRWGPRLLVQAAAGSAPPRPVTTAACALLFTCEAVSVCGSLSPEES